MQSDPTMNRILVKDDLLFWLGTGEEEIPIIVPENISRFQNYSFFLQHKTACFSTP